MLFKILNLVVQLDIIILTYFLQRDTEYKFISRTIMIAAVILAIFGLTV